MTKHPRLFAAIAGLTALFPAHPAGAGELEEPAALDAAIARFTGVPIGAAGGAGRPVDRRFRLARCGTPLVVAYHGKARASLSVACEGAGGWRIFVPLVAGAPQDRPLVSRGEAVAVQVRGRGFTVSARGEALQSGAEGATVPVRLTGQGREDKRLTATVVGPGTVAVDLM